MKYLLIVFAVMVLSLWWLNHQYKLKAKKQEQAKVVQVVKHQPASVPSPAVQPQPVAPASNISAKAVVAPKTEPVTAQPNAQTEPVIKAPAETATTSLAASPTSAAPADDPNKPPPPSKDWSQICYNASMQAAHAMRRRMEGALPAEITNIGNNTDPEYRESLQGIMNQVNTTPVTADFGQQQLDVDNIKSSTFNNCMAGHR